MVKLKIHLFHYYTLFEIIYFLIHFRWQARHEGDKQMRAGLIPSRMLQEKRIAYERAHSANNNADQQGKSF